MLGSRQLDEGLDFAMSVQRALREGRATCTSQDGSLALCTAGLGSSGHHFCGT